MSEENKQVLDRANEIIVEHWTQMDALGMMQQLGVIPAEEGATA